jgi:hypothetical protein
LQAAPLFRITTASVCQSTASSPTSFMWLAMLTQIWHW